MQNQDLATAIRSAVGTWMQLTLPDQQLIELRNPAELTKRLAALVETNLLDRGFVLEAARKVVLDSPYYHLEQVFVPNILPETPDFFTPVPDSHSTISSRAAVLALHGFLGKETVSYGTENDGALFVNLVAIDGEGKFAEKSTKSMRGHTDAVSFPFNGDFDLSNQRIAPSPDLVTLVGLRNPDAVPTTVMSLEDVLKKLCSDDIDELKKHQYTIAAQFTFYEGMRETLGDIHTAVDEPILKKLSTGMSVRYSHSSVKATVFGGPAKRASDCLEEACNSVAVQVVVAPGDVLVVSNRLCLHGRGTVGGGVGAQTRWLLRTYALDTSLLEDTRRHLEGRPAHVLYP